MSEMPEKITIDALKDLKEQQLIVDEVPLLQNEPDFDSMYQKTIVSHGIDLINDKKSKIISRSNGSFVIAKEQEDGSLVGALVIADKQELKQFISKIIDRYNREALSKLSSDVQRQVEVTYVPEGKDKKAEIQITVKEQLHELKEEVIGLADIEKLLNTLDNQERSTRKEIGKGQFHELRKLLEKQEPETLIAQQNIEIFTTLIHQAKEKHIDVIRKDIELIKKNKFTQNHAEFTSISKAKLAYIHAQFSEIERYVLNPDNMQKPFDTSIYNIETTAYSVNDITKLASAVNTQNAEIKNINEIAFNTALSKLDLEESDKFRHYLNEVLSGKIDPKKQKYHPEKVESFQSMLAQMPMLKGYVDIKNTETNDEGGKEEDDDGVYSKRRVSSGNKREHGPNAGPQYQEEVVYRETNEATNVDKVNFKDMSFEDSYKTYGVRGGIRKALEFSNASDEQKNGLTQLIYLGGVGFALFKGIKRFISGSKGADGKATTSFWERLGIVGGGRVGSVLLTGKSPVELIAGALNGDVSGFTNISKLRNKSAENATEYANTNVVYPLYTTMLWGQTKIKDLKPQIDAKTGKMLNYDQMMANITDKKIQNTLQKEIGKDDKNNIVPTGLAQLGIRPDSIDNLDQEKTVDDMYLLYMTNMQTAESYRTENGLITTKQGNEEIKKLVTSGEELTKKDFEALNEKGGMYTKEAKAETTEDKSNKAKLHTQIDALDLTSEEKENVKLGIDNFYNRLPAGINKKQVAIIQENGIIYLQTGAQKQERTAIDIGAKALKGFSHAFGSYFDLFASAHLTNRMKEVFGEKAAKSENPFHVEKITGNIVYDDTSLWEFYKKDTTAVSAGRFTSKLETISPVLEANKDDYVDYLNRSKNWKIANSPSVIPAIGAAIGSGVEKVKNALRGNQERRERTQEDFHGLDDKINRLCGNDTAKAKEISKAMNEFYNQMPNADRTIDIQGSRPVIEFMTYTNSTKINLANKGLDGFTPSRMTSYLELFKAANLTNYIKMVCNEQKSKKALPFYVGNPGRDIVFDNKSIRALSLDTEVVSAGRGGSLNKISPTLEKFKDDYVDYLNRNRDKSGLYEEVKEITGGNKERQRVLTEALNLFHESMPNGERKINIGGSREKLSIRTYGISTEVNMEKKSLAGIPGNSLDANRVKFTEANFPTHLELFKATSLTNRIRNIYGPQEGTAEPFNISIGGDVEFAHSGLLKRDTEVISGGLGGELHGISSTLEDHKSAYVKYLNQIRAIDRKQYE